MKDLSIKNNLNQLNLFKYVHKILQKLKYVKLKQKFKNFLSTSRKFQKFFVV